MDLTLILIIFGAVLVISLILRIFFAITKVIVIVLIIASLAAGTFFFVKGKIDTTPKSTQNIETLLTFN